MYVVFRKANVDPECKAFYAKNYEEGVDILQNDWENYYNNVLPPINIPKGIYYPELDEDYTYHEEDYASIRFLDGDQIEWFLQELELPKGKKNHV